MKNSRLSRAISPGVPDAQSTNVISICRTPPSPPSPMKSFRWVAFPGLDTRSSFSLDVTFKFKLADALPDQTSQILCNSFLMTWIRIFGPPKQVHSDQGGNFHGHGFAAFCDKLLIKRVPGGSEAAKPGNILLTGAVEKHTDLLKGTMSKAFADLTDAGHSVDITALLHEACMAHNTLPCYSGVPPISGVLGQPPRDLTDMANERAPLRSKRRTRPTCSSGAFCTASMRARPRSAPSLKRGSPARSMDIHSPWTSELS